MRLATPAAAIVAAPSVAPGTEPLAGLDWQWLPLVFAGLIIGAMGRAGYMVKAQRDWFSIRRDILVSVLVGGLNGLLATLAIYTFGLSMLEGVAVAALFAFSGVRTAQEALRWTLDKIAADHNKGKFRE